MKRTWAFAAAVLCCSTLSTIDAQTGWLPRGVNLGPNITGANSAAVLARIDAIERLVKQVPELAHPNGFEIRSSVEGDDTELDDVGIHTPVLQFGREIQLARRRDL